jgi:hypothetical protein
MIVVKIQIIVNKQLFIQKKLPFTEEKLLNYVKKLIN